MSKTLTDETWIWVIIQNPGNKEQILCQHDTTNDIKFIPSFYEKDHALMCINQFQKEEKAEFEPQAMFYDEVLNYASNNGFLIFMLNEKGIITDKLPKPPA